MLLSPLLSYITFGLLGLRDITFYFRIFVLFYGIFFVLHLGNKIKIPKPAYLLILYIIFLFIWTFYNGEMDRRGVMNILINNVNISILFIIIIIHNTRFSERFTNNSILIFKITVILAAIVSVIQVFDYSFLDANSLWNIGKFRNTLLGNIYLFRRSSIFGYVNQNEIGLSYMPLLAVLVGFLLHNRKKIFFFFLILGGISATLTNARYVIIAFLIITLQIFIFYKVKAAGVVKYILMALILLTILYSSLGYLGYDINKWNKERLFEEGTIKNTSRYLAYEIFLEYFPQKPLFGTGVHLTDEIVRTLARRSSQIHVGYLSHLVSYGIVGSFFLFGFWFLLAKRLYRTAIKTNYWGSFFAFLTFFWAQVTLVFFSIFFYGLIFALVFDKYFNDKYANLKKIKNHSPTLTHYRSNIT